MSLDARLICVMATPVCPPVCLFLFLSVLSVGRTDLMWEGDEKSQDGGHCVTAVTVAVASVAATVVMVIPAVPQGGLCGQRQYDDRFLTRKLLARGQPFQT